MKIIYDDILKQTRGIIVHGMNCQGVMGSGIAKNIRQLYPQVYDDYCDFILKHKNQKILGQILISIIKDDLFIVSAFTQEFYGRDKNKIYVDYNAIKSAFNKINKLAKETKLPILFPMIGAGLANGDFSIISKIIEEEIDINIENCLYIL